MGPKIQYNNCRFWQKSWEITEKNWKTKIYFFCKYGFVDTQIVLNWIYCISLIFGPIAKLEKYRKLGKTWKYVGFVYNAALWVLQLCRIESCTRICNNYSDWTPCVVSKRLKILRRWARHKILREGTARSSYATANTPDKIPCSIYIKL